MPSPSRRNGSHDGLLTTTELRERGWSVAMIAKVLGEPDATKRNPVRRRAAPTKLYERFRVQEAESTEAFEALRIRAGQRAAIARASAAVRIDRMLELVEAMPIEVQLVKGEAIEERASAAWRRREAAGRAERRSAGESDAAFTRRIAVNYARHELTRYDRALDETAARVGATAARERIRQRVYGAIAEAYPHLARECRRQLNHRGVPVPTNTTTGSEETQAERSPENADAKSPPFLHKARTNNEDDAPSSRPVHERVAAILKDMITGE